MWQSIENYSELGSSGIRQFYSWVTLQNLTNFAAYFVGL